MGGGAADLNTAAAPEPAMDDAQVVAFLRANPDFLARHPELFEILELRHASGAAVSLIERQVEILRGKSGRLLGNLVALLHGPLQKAGVPLYLDAAVVCAVLAVVPDAGVIGEAFRLGATDCVVVPADAADLVARVRHATW